MTIINYQTSPKQVRFIIEALDFRMDAYRKRLAESSIDDDEISDIKNDLYFLEEISKNMAKLL
jgi:hypothetical protein